MRYTHYVRWEYYNGKDVGITRAFADSTIKQAELTEREAKAVMAEWNKNGLGTRFRYTLVEPTPVEHEPL